jgi:hypothetical protein
MAHTRNRPATAPSAAHAATDPAPAPKPAPAPDSPAPAVHAALAANPGGTVAVIAGAAGTGMPATRDTLLAMEKNGTAIRVKGGKPGVPDTWTLASPHADNPGPAEARQDGPAGTASTVRSRRGASAAPESPAGTVPDKDKDPAGSEHDEPGPDRGDGRPDPGDGDGTAGDAAPRDPDSETSAAPDPALIAEITEHLSQIKAAADATLIVVTGGNPRAALAGMDEICEQATIARRSLRAAAGGRKIPAVRPGGLRDKVLAHLAANPGKAFTPHELHKVNGHSSGAIANALDTLVKLGEAEVAAEKPRRYRRAARPAAAPGPDTTGDAQDTGLEGAA